MFSKIPNPPSTDELVMQSLGIPITETPAPQANPTGFLPSLGLPIASPTQNTTTAKPVPPKPSVITEDSVISMVSRMGPEQAQGFMEKLSNKLLFAKYKQVIMAKKDQGDFVLNPVRDQVISIIEKAEEGGEHYICCLFPASQIHKLDHPEVSVEIKTISQEVLRGILKSWYEDILVNYLNPYEALFNAYTGKLFLTELSETIREEENNG